ncbi:MAG: cofactor-independent phosphoglycerate mutase [Clostridiales bacterium]|nr:cofactor-independent phosphoglycerate mutase [Clostridiales bacterium]
MKYVTVLCDGMADRNIKELGDITPMTKAYKPYMDMLASKAEVGMVKTVPDGFKPGSDVANLSVMGYDPEKCYTGRSPLEAAGIGIALKPTDVTLRCNFVTLSDNEPNYEDKILIDYCAGDISTDEAKILVEYLKKPFDNDEFTLNPGISYRHCLVWNNGDPEPGIITPPHDITGRCIKEYIPVGRSVDKLYAMMKRSYELLKNHPVNLSRIKNGKNPANSVWFWGEGTAPKLESFENKFGLTGSVISAVDLLKGIAACAQMGHPDVEGATGYIDTNFSGKLEAAVKELDSGKDFVYIHLEAPDECGHRGELENKIKSIELIDRLIIKPLLEHLERTGDYAVLICPDHPTPLEIRTHSSEPVPYLIYKSNREVNSGVSLFSEENAAKTGTYIEKGYTLIERLIK